jgi:U3 small nucleolar RNA-associated protein 22
VKISELISFFSLKKLDEDDFNDADSDVHSHGDNSGGESDGSGSMSVVEEAENEEEWGGINGATSNAAPQERYTGPTSKKLPAGEELRAIKDASDLFKSSSFKFQGAFLEIPLSKFHLQSF